MNRFAAAGAAVLVLLAAAACEAGAREPRSGMVTDLGYTEAEHWTETECGYTYDSGATSFVATFGGTAILWNLHWQLLVGIPLTAAVLEVAVALSSASVGKKGTASLTD